MAKPQVTITLGGSGQKVVKDSWGDLDRSRESASLPSGSKRSLGESFRSGGDRAFNGNKRMRDDVSVRSYGYSGPPEGFHLGAKDLRLKLARTRMLREIELKNEERKKLELHEKVSEAIQSLESSDDKLLRGTPSSRGAAETSHAGSIMSPFASWPSNGAGTRSPERIPRSSSGISIPRSSIHELPQLSTVRPINTSRTMGVFNSNPFGSSRPKVPMPTAPRHPLDAGKLVTEFPPAAGGMSIPVLQPSYLPKENQPLTVSGLLHSLGLGKYYINFQAEEIDMDVLKQMGEGDLKELGIPMGPRKKIFTALQARAKRPIAQVHLNYLQKC